jgi:hypothetical protein
MMTKKGFWFLVTAIHRSTGHPQAFQHARKPLVPRSPVLAAPSHIWNRQPARGFHSSGRARFPPGFERAPGAAAPVQIQQRGAVAFSIQVTTALSRCSGSFLR